MFVPMTCLSNISVGIQPQFLCWTIYLRVWPEAQTAKVCPSPDRYKTPANSQDIYTRQRFRDYDTRLGGGGRNEEEACLLFTPGNQLELSMNLSGYFSSVPIPPGPVGTCWNKRPPSCSGPCDFILISIEISEFHAFYFEQQSP